MFTPHTEPEIEEMLRAVGVNKLEDLFLDVPQAHRFPKLDLPPVLSEMEALKQLQKEPLAAFAVEFADLRGDILALQGKKAEARAAWQGGVDKLGGAVKAEGADAQREAAYRKLLTMKLESLGDGK